MSMIESWDLSLLIDNSTRIHDARGMTAQHFGVPLRDMPYRPFIDFVVPEQRAAFRRCIARVSGGKDMGLTAARLLTCEPEPRQFYMIAKRAAEPERWWLMIAADGPNAAAAAQHMANDPGLADDEEFIAMVEGAVDQLKGQVDMMRVASALLQGKQAAVKATPEVKEQLELKFTKIVLDNAYDGIATRPAPGEYVMLKDRERRADDIVQQLEAAAEELAITQLELGLEVATIGLERFGRNLRGTKLVRAMSELVEAGRDRKDEWGERLPPKKPWLKPAAIAAATGTAALIALLLFAF
ncbi:MAG TPA: hypothetical protein VG742_01005 [Dongiaceae bacterium]|nr:hypothetical protein [Dongiaceae bacterium]